MLPFPVFDFPRASNSLSFSVSDIEIHCRFPFLENKTASLRVSCLPPFCEDYISFLCYNITYFTVLCVHFGSNKWAPCCCFQYSNALSIPSFQPSRKTKLEKRMPWTFFICSRSFCGGRKFEKTCFVEWRLFARLLLGSTDPFSLILFVDSRTIFCFHKMNLKRKWRCKAKNRDMKLWRNDFRSY